MTTQTHPPIDIAGPSSTLPGLEPLLSIDDLAEYVGVPVVTIYGWRTEGKVIRRLLRPLSVGRTIVATTAHLRSLWIRDEIELLLDSPGCLPPQGSSTMV